MEGWIDKQMDVWSYWWMVGYTNGLLGYKLMDTKYGRIEVFTKRHVD